MASVLDIGRLYTERKLSRECNRLAVNKSLPCVLHGIKSEISVHESRGKSGIFTQDMKSRLAKGHNMQLEEVSNWDIISLAGAGGIRSTSSDMLKFIKANMSTTDTPLHKAMQLSHEIAYAQEDTEFQDDIIIK